MSAGNQKLVRAASKNGTICPSAPGDQRQVPQEEEAADAQHRGEYLAHRFAHTHAIG